MITNKKGVSLVTVLLFMLIATIAGTATYKWLSSAGSSSAARMQMQEAEFAAKSGIESARSWMTYHGAETGAIIRQYLKNKNPVSLDTLLTPMKSGKVNYSVWLIGADIETSPYKIKLLSFGKSANGSAKYSKSAILNVNGLYRVKVPKEPKTPPFEEALYSGPADGISLDVTSGIVNGDAKFNTKVDVQKKLVVTGDMSVNSSSIFKDLYVYGNMYTCTNFDVTNNTYVRGMVYLNGTQSYGGDFYAEGGLDLSGTGTGKAQCSTGSGGSITVGGNTTTNGNIITPKHTAANKYLFKGNVVLGNGSKLIFPNVSDYGGMIAQQGYSINFMGNVYLSGGINDDGFHLTYQWADSISFGTPGKKVYSGSHFYRVSDADGFVSENTDYYNYWLGGDVQTEEAHKIKYKTQWGGYNTSTGLASNTFCSKPNCGPADGGGGSADNFWYNKTFYNCGSDKTVQDWSNNGAYVTIGENCQIARNEVYFTVKGDYVTSVDTTGWGADPMSDVAESIVTTSEGNCTGPHIKEPLQFNRDLLNSPFVHSAEKKGACDGSDFYYNGVSFWEATNNLDRWPMLEKCYAKAKDAKELYDGKWLLIRVPGNNDQFHMVSGSDELTHNYVIMFDDYVRATLPATSADAQVMMYWPQGGDLFMADNATNRNYFIFSEGDIGWNADGKSITGSLFLSDCHKITGVNTIDIKYNSTLTSGLSNSAILCENDGTKSCSKTASSGGASGGEGGGYDSFFDDGYDQFFVPVSPQLLLTVESEYKSTKTDLTNKNGEAIKPSIIVMPRVIYLSRAPKGRLSDYYDVLNLNGATEVKDESKAYCSPTGIPTAQRFGSFTDSLKQGSYKCVYRTEAYEDSPFYVIVENTTESNMSIAFAEEKVEISKGETVDVPIRVPAGSTSPQPISVDIYVEKPSAWTVVPDQSMTFTGPKTNPNGSQVYTFSFIPGENPQTVTAFHVTMPDAENAGNAATFQLIPPCDGCIIGAPPYLGVVTSGTVKVKREEVSKYCDGYPTNCQNADGTNKYYSVIHAPACVGEGLLDPSDIWVYASGVDCIASISQPNDQWTCNMNHEVHLLKKTIPAVEKYCDIVIPPYDNSFSATFDGQEGVLYASVARKTKTLNLSVIGASDPNTAVLMKKSSNIHATEPDDNTSEICLSGGNCQFVVYPGYRYFFYAEPARTDDKFSYFKCSGKDCPTNAQIMAVNPYQLSVQEDDNTIIARFNDVDDHCLYEDFSPSDNTAFGSFCGADQTRCIDTCAVTQSAGNSCSVTEGSIERSGSGKKADWVMVYNNRKPSCTTYKYDDHTTCTYQLLGVWHPLFCSEKIGTTCGSKASNTKQLPPKIANNYITANADADTYSNYKNGTQAVILSSKDAGFNGTLTSLFTTSVRPIPNSGFIFRSNDNATEYFSLSVYGKAVTTIGSIYAASMIYARLCYVNGQTVGMNSASEKCVEKELTADQNTITSWIKNITLATSFTMVLDANGSEVNASFAVDRTISMDAKINASFDLIKEFGISLDDERHNRVGMKLSDENFNVHDISWMSENYNGECWAAPKIVCSFKSNYLGGMVPKDADVTPWVSYSSFLNDKKYEKCKLKFYYNGCDMNIRNFELTWNTAWNSMYQVFGCVGSGTNKIGSYWDVGSPISGAFYNFNRDGKHGYYVPKDGDRSAGFALDAKVILDCSNASVTPPSSLQKHQTCGEFLVGKMEYCSESYEYFASSDAIDCNNGGCIIDTKVNGMGTNLRDALLELKFSNPDEAQIKVVLLDDAGTESQPATVTGTSYSLDVNSVSNVDGFNPQAITEVRVTSENSSVGVYSVMSNCPYALGVSSCTAFYNGISWTVDANVTNAFTCDVTPPLALSGVDKKENVICDGHSSFSFENPDLLAGLGSETDFEFSITAYNQDKSKSFTKSCVTTSVKPITATCDVEDSKRRVMKGTGVPAFNFTFENCDQYRNGTCNYQVSLKDLTDAVPGSASSSAEYTGSTSPFNTINQPSNPLPAGTYSWLVVGPSTLSTCYASFDVYEPNYKADADLCNLSEEGIFSADITSSGDWIASLSITDAYGFVKITGINSVEKTGDGRYNYQIDESILTKGDHVALILNGSEVCSKPFGVEDPGTDPGTDPDDPIDDPEKPAQILCHYRTDGQSHNSWEPLSLGPGKYVWKHNCKASPGWWVYCNGSVIVNGTSYECNKQTNLSGGTYTAQNHLVPSGSIIEVPEGVTLKKIGCEANPGVPEGCEGHPNEVIDGDGTVVPSTPTGKKTICIASNGTAEAKLDNIPVGNYGLVQNCNPDVFYKCTGDVKLDGTALTCDNNEHKFSAPLAGSAVPELTVTGSLSYLKCAKNSYAYAMPSCPSTEVKDEEPPSYTGNRSSCNFDKSSYGGGEQAVFKFKTSAWNGRDYELLDPNGTKVGEGKIPAGEQETSITVSNPKSGDYSLSLKATGVMGPGYQPAQMICKATANVLVASASCNITASDNGYQFRADLTNCGSGCKWYLKQNGSNIASGTSYGSIGSTLDDYGEYTLHLGAENSAAVCTETIAKKPQSTSCWFGTSSQTQWEYDKTYTFTVKDLRAKIYSKWTLHDPDGNVIDNGTFLAGWYGSVNWSAGASAKLKKGGEYVFKIEGEEYCATTVTLKNAPKAENCRFDNSTIGYGSTTTFRFQMSGCDVNWSWGKRSSDCEYEVLLNGTVIGNMANVDNGEQTMQVAAGGTYKVKVNGNETCSATLEKSGTAIPPGTYQYAVGDWGDANTLTNGTIDGPFIAGSYTFQMNRACSHAQMHAGGMSNATYTINGSTQKCEYKEISITPLIDISLNIGAGCEIQKIYFWDCKGQK